jgi:hypothetical protein
MRTARDLILVICAIITTLCVLYIAIHLHTSPDEEDEAPPSESQGSKSK